MRWKSSQKWSCRILLWTVRGAQSGALYLHEILPWLVADLKQYNGKNDAPIFLAVRGFVFDVTEGRDFYGPGGAYEVLAGRDASLGLAVMDTDESKWPKKASMDELTGMETDTLNDWLQRFEDKYPLVGFLPEGFDGRSLEEMTAAAQAQAEAEFQAEEAALTAAGSDSEEGGDAQLRNRGDDGRTYADAAAAAVVDSDKDKAE